MWLHFCAHTSQFYLSYYDNDFHSHQIFAYLRPCAKCAKICTAQTFLRLQYNKCMCNYFMELAYTTYNFTSILTNYMGVSSYQDR